MRGWLVISLSVVFFCFFSSSFAAELTKADELFENRAFQEAANIYEKIFQESARDEIRWKAFFRLCDSLAHLYRYGEAAEKVLQVTLPERMPYKALVLVLKAEILQNFSLQYSSIQSTDIREGETDVFRLTPKQLQKEIISSYQALLRMSRELAQVDLRAQGYFFQIEGVDFGMYPTLFDYVIFSWIHFILQDAQNMRDLPRPQEDIFLVENFRLPVDIQDSPGMLALELIEEASRLRSAVRFEAGERWEIERLIFPFQNAHLYDFKDIEAARRKAKAILLRWMRDFSTAAAKAQAGLEAGILAENLQSYAEAVNLYEEIERTFPGTFSSKTARARRQQIELQVFHMRVLAAQSDRPQTFFLSTNNIKKIYFRAYQIDPQVLYRQEASERKNVRGWSSLLNNPENEWVKKYVTQKSYCKTWVFDIPKYENYKAIHSEVALPPDLPLGVFLILASPNRNFSIGSEFVWAGFLNITDFALLISQGQTTKARTAYYQYLSKKNTQDEKIDDAVFRFYALNLQTGEPIEKAEITSLLCDLNHSGSVEKTADSQADSRGFASLSVPVAVFPEADTRYSLDPLARHKGASAYLRNNIYFFYEPPNPIIVFAETDRPIYRPSDTVNVKAIGMWRTPQGFRTLQGGTVKISASDPNSEEFFSKEIPLGEFASESLAFQIPKGRVLGNYSISVLIAGEGYSNVTRIPFVVEEYKRPEFEIILEKASEPWKYNQPVTIRGKARYYFGGVVPDAPVKYRIKKRFYLPWCFRHWVQSYSDYPQDLVAGDIKTDAQGNFFIPFTPVPQGAMYGGNALPDISQFIIEVEGRDAGGRTITAQQAYTAGKEALYFVIEPEKGFFFEHEPIRISSALLTLNETPLSASGSYEVFRLSDTPAKSLDELGFGYSQEYGNLPGHWLPPLDLQLKDVANDKKITEGVLEHGADGKAQIELSKLPQGVYRITERTEDPWGQKVEQSKIFVVAKNPKSAVPVNAASVMLSEKEQCAVGDIARFVIGSSFASGIYCLELWANGYFLRNELLPGKFPVQVLEVPVTEEMKGGFSLRWFGVKNGQTHSGAVTISVPWPEKKLQVIINPFTKELAPGKETAWGIEVKDDRGNPEQAEALALMYDRSLEYYAVSQHPWLDSLYALDTYYGLMQHSAFIPYFSSLPITEGMLEKILSSFREKDRVPQPPSLRSWRSWLGLRRGLGKDEGYSDSLCLGTVSKMAEVSNGEKDRKSGYAGSNLREQQSSGQVKSRKEFADTAFFKPSIITGKDGKALFSFTAPEQLTSWRAKIFAFTKDAKEGTAAEEAVTRKDLMVRADIPRFFREKDKGTLTAVVHNESGKALRGELSLEVFDGEKNINDALKISGAKKSFFVEPNSLQNFQFPVEIPEGVSAYKVRVAAISGKLSDAEERMLPILSSRERLIESTFGLLSGTGEKKIEIKLKADPTRQNESMVLQIEPQLILSILNSIPFLIEYPYECVEQMLNKYVPLSIVNEVYKKYPDLQRAVSKIPTRMTPSPAWEKDSPTRLITLLETPWMWQSKGRPTPWPIIDLLNPEIVKEQRDSVFARLSMSQLPNGAFPWWPGGAADPYITLYVLDGFAHARRYGVEVPWQVISKALAYVNQEIPLKLKAEDSYLALVAYAAYVVTSFSVQEFPQAKAGFDAARSWVVFLDKHSAALTPFGKAYLAYVHLRLGDRKRAEEILDMALDGAREDPIAGVYWTPEKYSWVWYSDTVEKHAFLLKTLQELRPEDKRIPGMVQWLLFSRKAGVWKSTKASAAAIYSLLDFLNAKGAFGADEKFLVQWGGVSDSLLVKADDWLEKPLRWQKNGSDIRGVDTSVTVKKEGPGIAFTSLTWVYSTDQVPEASMPGLLALKRVFYRRVKEEDGYHLKPLAFGGEVSVGDQVEVELTLNTRSQFEYMHLKDPKPAGFEAETLLSGWKYDPLSFYEEPRDSLTNFFISWIPHGEYVVRYRLKPTKAGVYRVGAATLQSMYAPEMTAHSDGFVIKVNDGSLPE